MEPSWKTSLSSRDPEERKNGIKSLIQTEGSRALTILKYIYDHDPDPSVKALALKGARFLHQKSDQEKPQVPEDQSPISASVTPPAPRPVPRPAPKPLPEPLPAIGSEPTKASPSDSDVPSSEDSASMFSKKISAKDVQSANQKLQQALTQQMRGENEKAFNYIAAAFKLNPELTTDTFAVNLACSLTGLPQSQALAAVLNQDIPPTAMPPVQDGASTVPVEIQTPVVRSQQDFGKENKIEQKTRELLESLLPPGEKLLAYSGGALPGVITTMPVAVGLTGKRLLLQRLKRGEASSGLLSIDRSAIESIQTSKLGGRLQIKLLRGNLTITPNKPYWKTRNKSLVELIRIIPRNQPGQKLPLEDQLATLEKLGLINTALEICKNSDKPEEIESYPVYQELKDQRFSYQVGAGFLLINVLAGFFFALLGIISGLPVLPTIFVSAIIDILIGVNLWKGQVQPWAGWALVRAVLGAIIYGILYLGQGLYLDLFAQISFCGAIILVLTGTRDRLRAYTAIGIYTIGFLGIITVSFIYGLISGLGG
jgi:hypothetical protein